MASKAAGEESSCARIQLVTSTGEDFSYRQTGLGLTCRIDAILGGDTRLGKTGVAPDVLVPDDAEHPNGFSDQLVMASNKLTELVEKSRGSALNKPAGN
jgi:hypothetical protein